MRIAIIGTGISGLTAAHRLHHDHELTLFESNTYIGGHTHTVQVDLADETQHVDTGFIVYNPVNYPGFQSILDDLDVDSQPTCMSFSVSDSQGKLEYNGTNLNRLFAQRSNLFRPRFYGMIRDILRFGKDIDNLLDSEPETDETVDEFTKRHGYRELFRQRYLMPLGAALWSCPTETFEQFPVRFVGEFLSNHFMLQVGGRPQWRVIQGGSSRYVEKLIQPFADRIQTSCSVQEVKRYPDRVDIFSEKGLQKFDHVIFACHADQALSLLHQPSANEKSVLGLFPYQKNEIFLHTDDSVLPKRKRAWAAWNAKILNSSDGNRSKEFTAVSYNMNILQSLKSQRTFCVTLNESSIIDSKKIIGQFTYHHPLFSVSRTEAVQRHQELLNQNRTSFCGAYWGFGFHEDGVQSAFRVANSIQQEVREKAG